MFSLYPHQQAAMNQLKSGSVLSGGVGSGKSRTSLAYYFLKECEGDISNDGYMSMRFPKNLYIITTARKRDTLEWNKECIPFLLDDACNPYGVHIVVDSWNNIGKYCNVCGAFFIFDEQRVVGSGAWVKSFLQITKKNHWILLSATPGDTWMDYIPVFIANGFYKNRSEFIREHVVFDHFVKYPKVRRYIQCGKLIACRDKILVHMRYSAPAKKNDLYVDCKYDEELYKTVAVDRWNAFEDEPIENISQACYLMRKVANTSESRKEEAKEIIYQNPKIIIFYNFDYELEILRNIANELEVPCAEWNGHKHMGIPKTEKWIYLVQYTAGAEGWNCIETNTILFYSQNYSYRIMVQSSGRVDRLNTPYSNLYYYHLVSKAPIDVAIRKALSEKRDFNESKFAS